MFACIANSSTYAPTSHSSPFPFHCRYALDLGVAALALPRASLTLWIAIVELEVDAARDLL